MSSSLVDRIYEKWLCKFNKNASVLSSYDAPIGHNKDDVIVPLYPEYTHQKLFKSLSSSVMITTMSTRMVSTHEVACIAGGMRGVHGIRVRVLY